MYTFHTHYVLYVLYNTFGQVWELRQGAHRSLVRSPERPASLDTMRYARSFHHQHHDFHLCPFRNFIITFIIILVIIMLSVTRFLQRDEQWSNTDGVIPWWITWRLSLNRWLPRHWPQWTSGNWALCRHCPFWCDHHCMYSAKWSDVHFWFLRVNITPC